MMMEALIAGGMDAAWSSERNVIAHQHADSLYHPNKSGLFEIPLSEYDALGFPLQYEGKLIKVMSWGLLNIAVHKYRVVFMRRDFEEIRQSYQAFFGGRLKLTETEFRARLDKAESFARNRHDIETVTTLNYRDVIDSPRPHMNALISVGWEFDVEKASEIIDKSRCRFRKEILVSGI